ncbi:histidine phosphatase family protein [Spirulina major]|uniref:histidine phosphatase family protein n=1 Tax=Spirulina major TaxID=270636 RepID=UPI00093427A3|nr:histidine phosphatase family protein [Spirulina major]
MMLGYHRRVVFGGLLLLGLASCGATPPPSVTAPSPAVTAPPSPQTSSADAAAIAPATTDIWSRLRNAETHYYVLMRHAIAPGSGDPPNFAIGDCSTQRNLSEEGRDQARRTGAAFQTQNITVQQVLSSEWCRCQETATLMDLGPVETFPALNSFFQDRAQGPDRIARLREFMANHREEAGVTVLVTHFVTIADIAGGAVSSGELVVMQINTDNEPEVVGNLGPF